MLFQSKRKIATRAAIQNVKPIVVIVQQLSGIPYGFWEAPYVIGFFGFLISHHADTATDKKISALDLGHVLRDVFSEISRVDGSVLSAKHTALHREGHPAVNSGADDAAALCFFSMRRLKDESRNVLVVKALELVGQTSDRQRVYRGMLGASILEAAWEIGKRNSNGDTTVGLV